MLPACKVLQQKLRTDVRREAADATLEAHLRHHQFLVLLRQPTGDVIAVIAQFSQQVAREPFAVRTSVLKDWHHESREYCNSSITCEFYLANFTLEKCLLRFFLWFAIAFRDRQLALVHLGVEVGGEAVRRAKRLVADVAVGRWILSCLIFQTTQFRRSSRDDTQYVNVKLGFCHSYLQLSL